MKSNIFKYVYLSIAVCSTLLASNIGYTDTPNAGLNNIGATCYMNATVQSLAHIPSFNNWFLNALLDNKMQNATESQLIHEWGHVIRQLQNRPGGNYSPYTFKDLLGKSNQLFQGVAANDSKDLINYLIMTGHEELNTKKSNNIQTNNNFNLDQRNAYQQVYNFVTDFNNNNSSPFSEHFYATNWNITQCSNCKTCLYNAQTYFFLVFPLDEVRKARDLSRYTVTPQYCNTNTVTLSDCFNYDSKINTMIGSNMMYCNYCRQTCASNMRTQLLSTPETLIIILNRGKGIEFNVNLLVDQFVDLKNFVVDEESSKRAKYYLSSVIVHIGESGMGGHFICYSRKSPVDKWYKYNDAIVTCMQDDQNVLNQELINVLNGQQFMSYVLFYTRLDEQQAKQATIQPLAGQIVHQQNLLPLNSQDINTKMDASTLWKYISFNRNPNKQTILGNNLTLFMNKANNIVNNIMNRPYKKENTDGLLQLTIEFIHNWSTGSNKNICGFLATTWAKVLKHLFAESKNNPQYFDLYKDVYNLLINNNIVDRNISINLFVKYNIYVQQALNALLNRVK